MELKYFVIDTLFNLSETDIKPHKCFTSLMENSVIRFRICKTVINKSN